MIMVLAFMEHNVSSKDGSRMFKDFYGISIKDFPNALTDAISDRQSALRDSYSFIYNETLNLEYPLCVHVDTNTDNKTRNIYFKSLLDNNEFEDITFYHRFQKSNYSIQYLLTSPIIAYATTPMSFPLHIIRGCDYTISLWMWLWKPKNVANNPDHLGEYVIFNTRRLFNPATGIGREPLLPAIIFNVGKLTIFLGIVLFDLSTISADRSVSFLAFHCSDKR